MPTTATTMGSNLHRKLLNATEDEQPGSVVPKPCKIFCDARQNPLGLCPPLCTNFCDQVCKDPPPLQLLPDAPPPITKAAPLVISHGKHFNLALFLEIVLALLVAGFLFLTLYAIYKLCIKCRRSRARRRSPPTGEEITRERDTDEFLDGEDYGAVLDHPIWYIRTTGLQPSVIGSIAIVRFKKGDGLVEGTDCSICLAEFEEDESLRLLPKCSHAFHVPCIDTWLRSHTNCPLCRAPIVNNPGGAVPPPREMLVVEDSNDARDDVNVDGEVRNEPSENELAVGISEGFCSDGEQDCNNNQPMRRSVSITAWRIDEFLGKCDAEGNYKLEVEDKESSSTNVKNLRCSSMERSVQGECCSSVRRSASCVLLSRK